jgi:hypothetical protein
MKSWTFKLPTGAGKKTVDISSVTIREVTGRDEELASVLTEAKGKNGSMAVEILRLSIEKVDGRKVEQPYGELDGWNARTRKFVLDAWASINSVSQDEAEDFLSGAQPDVQEGEGASIVALSSGHG